MDDRERRVLASATPIVVPVVMQGLVPLWNREQGDTGYLVPILMRVTTLN